MVRLRRTINLITAVAAMVLAACSSAYTAQGTSAAKPQRGGTLVFAIDSYPQDMNPYSDTADTISIAVFGTTSPAWLRATAFPRTKGPTRSGSVKASSSAMGRP